MQVTAVASGIGVKAMRVTPVARGIGVKAMQVTAVARGIGGRVDFGALCSMTLQT